MISSSTDFPRSRLQALTRGLRVAIRMIPRMYWVPLRQVWRHRSAAPSQALSKACK